MIKYKYKKKKKNLLVLANLHVKSNLKNTIISLTKNTGDVLKQWSTKSLKKTKFKKNTPYNVQLIVYKINKYIQLKKIKKINIYLKGTGLGRYNIIRNLKKKKVKIGYIFDKTSIPFNGCRKKKMKRL
jgi:small subunit ribosomal protein S11